MVPYLDQNCLPKKDIERSSKSKAKKLHVFCVLTNEIPSKTGKQDFQFPSIQCVSDYKMYERFGHPEIYQKNRKIHRCEKKGNIPSNSPGGVG